MKSSPTNPRTLEQDDAGRAPSRSRADIFLDALHGLIGALGKDGGISNGSIYDTAMVVRLAPPPDGGAAALEWLFKAQNPDGSWDNPKIPRARETPTLAAMLALHVRGKGDPRTPEAVQRGLKFLLGRSNDWKTLPEDLLVGVEMTLTRLLEDARTLELVTGSDMAALEAQFAVLIEDGIRRRQKIRKLAAHVKIPYNTPPAIMWEGWGHEPEPSLVSPAGGVGLSPAATAAWLHAAKDRPELQNKCKEASDFLRAAEAGTLDGIPGVVPATWPIDGMEKQWGLYALLCAGLLNHERLADVVKRPLDELSKEYGAAGIGFTEHFMPDGDCTAVTAAILQGAHLPVSLEPVRKFKRDDHFFTYPQETNLSLTTTAHAVMTLREARDDASNWRAAEEKLWEVRDRTKLEDGVTEDGRWLVDKWQTSWLYTTTHVMMALADREHPERMADCVDMLLREQREGGGWGEWDKSTPVETAYAVLALLWLQERGCGEPQRVRLALARAYRYLLDQKLENQGFQLGEVPKMEPMWIGKALYCPYRMDRAFELSALAALALKEEELGAALKEADLQRAIEEETRARRSPRG